MLVIKRWGGVVDYDPSLIITAVKKAAKNTGIHEQLPRQVLQYVEDYLFGDTRDKVTVECIESLVEKALMKLSPDTARAYIEFRHDRDVARERNSELNSNIKGLVEQSDLSLINENANKDSKIIPTQRDLLAGIVAKHYAIKHILPKQIVDAHNDGVLHYHDLDYAPFFPMYNCMLIDIQGMFTKGFKMGNAEIETPKSIATATAVTAQIIAQVASHIYGGTTVNRIDEVLAPYVTASYEKHVATGKLWGIENPREYALALVKQETYNAFQSLEYEINTLQSANGQTPFTTLGFGLGTSWESVLIQESILKVRLAGLGKRGKTAIFPKLILAIKKGVNFGKEDPNYAVKQLALKCASKRMYPDILNYDKVVEVTGSFKTPMGCRSFLDDYIVDGESVHSGRNNLGVVSLNLPRIAIQAKGDENLFYGILRDRLLLARSALETRIERLATVKASVAPILYMEGACGVRLKADDNVIDIFKDGRASISLGYIGLHEAVLSLYGDDMHTSAYLQEKAVSIIKCLKGAVDSWRQETGWGYSLYATPSENLCNRFCALDREEFGEIAGITDKGYYTNSFHVDVAAQVNPYDKIDLECAYPPLSSGGFICYGEYPNMERNLRALEDVWDYSYGKVPYYGTNTPIDECYKCGFTGEFYPKSKGFVCPSCGNNEKGTMVVTRRVCGYLGNPEDRGFNQGKQLEVINRVKHL